MSKIGEEENQAMLNGNISYKPVTVTCQGAWGLLDVEARVAWQEGYGSLSTEDMYGADIWDTFEDGLCGAVQLIPKVPED